mmetsp:Transcript_62469/g.152090  ORF Transcript_62469/g.152090 Transcript_62469/m.152090 type:complete len:102 (-) Transcript_62469:1123-1428(-)
MIRQKELCLLTVWILCHIIIINRQPQNSWTVEDDESMTHILVIKQPIFTQEQTMFAKRLFLSSVAKKIVLSGCPGAHKDCESSILMVPLLFSTMIPSYQVE